MVEKKIQQCYLFIIIEIEEARDEMQAGGVIISYSSIISSISQL